MSPPSRRRGLKYDLVVNVLIVKLVASLAEAWIEIAFYTWMRKSKIVASLAEAWIEIRQ